MPEDNIKSEEIIKEKRILSALGLAKKASKAISGTEILCDAVRNKKVNYIVLSEYASENSKKRIINCAAYYKVKLITIKSDLVTLGHAIGKSPTACVGITDKNFTTLIDRNIESIEN